MNAIIHSSKHIRNEPFNPMDKAIHSGIDELKAWVTHSQSSHDSRVRENAQQGDNAPEDPFTLFLREVTQNLLYMSLIFIFPD
jgi:hypothetical protein